MASLERLRSGLHPDSWRSHLRPTKTTAFAFAFLLLPISGGASFSALSESTLNNATNASVQVEALVKPVPDRRPGESIHLDGYTVDELIAQGERLNIDRRFDDAKVFYEKALSMLGSSPTERLKRAHILCNLGSNNLNDEDPEIDRQFSEAQSIYLELEGPESPGFARSLSCQATLMLIRGHETKALPHLETALQMQRVDPGPSHPHYLETLHSVAHCYVEATTEYEKAIAALEEVLATRKRIGAHPKLIAWTHHDLGIAYHQTRNLPKAIENYSQAAMMRGRYDDPFMVKYWVESQLTWGSCLAAMRNYAPAIITIEEVLLRLAAYPEAEPGMLLRTYQKLGWVRAETGDNAQAEWCFGKAMDLAEANPELKDHHAYSSTLGSLAELLANEGRYLEALEHAEKHYILPGAHDVETSPSQFRAQAEIGLYRVMVGGSTDGLLEINRALEGLQSRKDASSRDVGQIYHDLGQAHVALGNFPEAIEAYSAVLEALQGIESEDATALSAQSALAELYFSQVEDELAWKFASDADSESYHQLLETLQALSERAAVLFARKFQSSFPTMAHIASRDPQGSDRVAATWDVLIRNRSLTLEEMSRRRRFRARHELASQGAYEALAVARDKLTRLVRIPNLNLREEDRDQAIHEAEQELDWAERTVAQQMREPIRPLDWGVAELAGQLPPNSSLVSYVRVPGILGGEDWYGAFVLNSSSRAPIFFRLGSASEIDARADRVMHHLNQSVDALALDWEASLEAYITLAAALGELVWSPIAEHLQHKNVFLVPDGALSTIPFQALPTDSGTYLIEQDWSFAMLFSERDLKPKEPSSPGNGMLVIGDVDFDSPMEGVVAPAEGLFATRGYENIGVDLEEVYFNPLHHTREEVLSVSQSWRELMGTRAQSLFGKAAQEAKVADLLPGLRYGHFATHGFVVHPSTTSSSPGGATRFHSGLALAGANSKAVSYSENDGLLLAGEIQLLDLTGMELVVLSACHTGLGEIEAGEGVFGLPRAFRIAGARSLVVSLFAVDDAMTQEWMKKFYFRHFRENKPVLQAYNETMDEKLSKLRSEGKTTHPFYWAGFVAVGH